MDNHVVSLDSDNPQPVFVAELTPYRSLGPNGFLVLMICVGVLCFSSGLIFLVAGAWPVFVFLGLDVALVWLAFKLNYRAARARELISVDVTELRVQKYDPAGRMREYVFNPFGTRFEVDRHEEIGITQMRITNRERSLPVGAFLNPADKESFATAFGQALVRAKA